MVQSSIENTREEKSEIVKIGEKKAEKSFGRERVKGGGTPDFIAFLLILFLKTLCSILCDFNKNHITFI